jgi:hypothetical protein
MSGAGKIFSRKKIANISASRQTVSTSKVDIAQHGGARLRAASLPGEPATWSTLGYRPADRHPARLRRACSSHWFD